MSKTRNRPMVEWKNVNWKQLERRVFKLQKRIYKAQCRGDVKAVRKLQKTLINSWSSKMLAVRKVTQDNMGKRTAGVDGVKSLTPAQRYELVRRLKLSNKSKPVRRIYIPKPGKAEKRHGSRYKSAKPPNALPPLGIPTMQDRATQALVKLALEPQWEAKFEPNSFGFRPGRSAHDAINAIHGSISMCPKWVLDADISKCFDRIDHKALIEKVNTFPKLRKQIKAWLKSGTVELKNKYTSTQEGTPQGGVLSPLLANIALHGLENHIMAHVSEIRISGKINRNKQKSQTTIVRYADDFVVIHPEKETLLALKQEVENWLKKVGLELNQAKTTIVHTLEPGESSKPGFDFLGFSIRQYNLPKRKCTSIGGKYKSNKLKTWITIIKPSQEAIQRQVEKIGCVLKELRSNRIVDVITKLNPIINGWANYYSGVNSCKTFSKVDNILYHQLWGWARFSYSRIGKKAIAQHTGLAGHGHWQFYAELNGKKYQLSQHYDHKIRRFPRIVSGKSPFDGDWLYWGKRMSYHPECPKIVSYLLKAQDGKCARCGSYLKVGDLLETDHIIPRSKGGRNSKDNLQLLHRHCHDNKTAEDKNVSNFNKEEDEEIMTLF